jgi:hypothetical protein
MRSGANPVPAKTRRDAAPAAERRRAESELRALIARLVPAQARLVGALRRWMGQRLPTAHEVVYEYRDAVVISYSPSGRGYEGVLSIRADAVGARLYFNFGTALPDPAGLLQGSGHQTRFLNVESASALARPEVARLIEEVIARHRVPFTPSGRGPLIIRSTSAQRRARG